MKSTKDRIVWRLSRNMVRSQVRINFRGDYMAEWGQRALENLPAAEEKINAMTNMELLELICEELDGIVEMIS